MTRDKASAILYSYVLSRAGPGPSGRLFEVEHRYARVLEGALDRKTRSQMHALESERRPQDTQIRSLVRRYFPAHLSEQQAALESAHVYASAAAERFVAVPIAGAHVSE